MKENISMYSSLHVWQYMIYYTISPSINGIGEKLYNTIEEYFDIYRKNSQVMEYREDMSENIILQEYVDIS